MKNIRLKSILVNKGTWQVSNEHQETIPPFLSVFDALIDSWWMQKSAQIFTIHNLLATVSNDNQKAVIASNITAAFDLYVFPEEDSLGSSVTIRQYSLPRIVYQAEGNFHTPMDIWQLHT